MLEHGGRLRQAAKQYGIELSRWTDLSTGVNPNGWQSSELPLNIWQALPEDDDGLMQAASNYYGACNLLALPGSQAAIQLLPKLRKLQGCAQVGMLDVAYAEHQYHWQQQGHQVITIDYQLADDAITLLIESLDILLLVHPNNPSGRTYSKQLLLKWHKKLASKGGWLVVDEAFIDGDERHSLVGESYLPGLLVLRSIGKFFGLAGARVGFVFAEKLLLEELGEMLGPWPISSASRWIAQQALGDDAWQQLNQQRLISSSARLKALLLQHGLKPQGGTTLFQWCIHERSVFIQQYLAERALLVRVFTHSQSVRFGLPANEHQWRQLTRALNDMAKVLKA